MNIRLYCQWQIVIYTFDKYLYFKTQHNKLEKLELMFSKIKSLICKFDLFSCLAVLRVKGQASMAKATTGFFSFILLCFFLWMLIRNLIQIANMQTSQINYSSSLQVDTGDRTINNIMMAIKIQNIDGLSFNQLQSFFTARVIVFGNNVSLSQMVQCTPDKWTLLGSDYQNIFVQNKLGSYFCLPDLLNLTSPTLLPIANIYVSGCQYSFTVDCKNQTQITNLYRRTISAYNYFPVRVGFMFPYADVSDKNPLKYLLDFKDFGTELSQGEIVDIIVDEFRIQTDKSVWPIAQYMSYLYGYSFKQISYSYFSYDSNRTIFDAIFQAQMVVTNDIIVYSQSINKIDQALSYIGGLMGIVLFLFTFCIKSFNQYRYELFVGQKAFNLNTDGHKVRQKDFNFFKYLKYRLFYWTQLFFCYKLEWKQQLELNETLYEARNLLQVNKLFRRIEVLQKVIWKTNDTNILMTLILNENNSLQQVQKRRLILQYYHAVINQEDAATVEDAITQDPKSFRYLQNISSHIHNKASNDQKFNDMKKSSKVLSLGSIQNIQNQQNELKQKLMKHLKLQDFPEVCQAISKYSLISMQAQMFEFDQDDQQQMKQIQEQITEAFINLDSQTKYRHMQKIPLKIIHRMRITATQMQNKSKKSENLPHQMKQQQGQHTQKYLNSHLQQKVQN